MWGTLNIFFGRKATLPRWHVPKNTICGSKAISATYINIAWFAESWDCFANNSSKPWRQSKGLTRNVHLKHGPWGHRIANRDNDEVTIPYQEIRRDFLTHRFACAERCFFQICFHLDMRPTTVLLVVNLLEKSTVGTGTKLQSKRLKVQILPLCDFVLPSDLLC